MLHLGAGMPDGAQAAGQQILIARKIGIHRDTGQAVARLDIARSKTFFARRIKQAHWPSAAPAVIESGIVDALPFLGAHFPKQRSLI
jgi:hypothetical protein